MLHFGVVFWISCVFWRRSLAAVFWMRKTFGPSAQNLFCLTWRANYSKGSEAFWWKRNFWSYLEYEKFSTMKKNSSFMNQSLWIGVEWYEKWKRPTTVEAGANRIHIFLLKMILSCILGLQIYIFHQSYIWRMDRSESESARIMIIRKNRTFVVITCHCPKCNITFRHEDAEEVFCPRL